MNKIRLFNTLRNSTRAFFSAADDEMTRASIASPAVSGALYLAVPF